MLNVLEFIARKNEKNPITMVTAYDVSGARIATASEVDCLLVGDSVAMVVHGFSDTLHATVELMELHVAAVARGASGKFIVADMPFLSFRKGVGAALECVGRLARAGAQAVKLEGVRGHEEVIEAIVGSGIPVMGHLGMTPQSVHGLGGFRVQGRGSEAANTILEEAKQLEALGAFAVVLECIPSVLAEKITSEIKIPTIGIGAGPHVDGQVLVFHDVLGLNPGFNPKFLKKYMDAHGLSVEALNAFARDVASKRFPTMEESYA